jgi:hypothetical protein
VKVAWLSSSSSPPATSPHSLDAMGAGATAPLQLPADRLQAHDPDRCDTLTTHGTSAHVTFGSAPHA